MFGDDAAGACQVNQPPLCQEPTDVQNQHLQQFVLIRREFDLAIPDLNDVAVQANCEIACHVRRKGCLNAVKN